MQFTDQLDTDPGAVSGTTPLAALLQADATGVLAPIKPVLAGADLAMVNLETALTDRGEPVAGKNYHFRSPAASLTALKAAGVDVVNMANNHALDYGPVGMQDTFDAIAASKLPVIGIGHNATEAYAPFRTTIKGQRIAIFERARLARARADPLVVGNRHPGGDRVLDRPHSPCGGDPRRTTQGRHVGRVPPLGHRGDVLRLERTGRPRGTTLLDAGADIVVGSHAHRVFGAGHVGTSLVAYGLGNFVYWREDGESGRSGVLLVTATGREVDTYSWVPARITNGIPVPQTGDAAATDLAEWNTRRNCSGLAP